MYVSYELSITVCSFVCFVMNTHLNVYMCNTVTDNHKCFSYSMSRMSNFITCVSFAL